MRLNIASCGRSKAGVTPAGRATPRPTSPNGRPRSRSSTGCDYPDIDVRVDVHPTAVEELRRVLEEFKLYEEFYRDRGRNPSKAIPQDVFVANLKARRA